MTTYLIDTHILLWMRTGSDRLPLKIAALIEEESDRVHYSVLSPWELAIKEAKGKLRIPEAFFTTLPEFDLGCMNVKNEHVNALRSLPLLHHDPFDRMLVAQAKAERMTLITSDKRLAAYPIKTLLI